MGSLSSTARLNRQSRPRPRPRRRENTPRHQRGLPTDSTRSRWRSRRPTCPAGRRVMCPAGHRRRVRFPVGPRHRLGRRRWVAPRSRRVRRPRVLVVRASVTSSLYTSEAELILSCHPPSSPADRPARRVAAPGQRPDWPPRRRDPDRPQDPDRPVAPLARVQGQGPRPPGPLGRRPSSQRARLRRQRRLARPLAHDPPGEPPVKARRERGGGRAPRQRQRQSAAEG